MDSILVVYYSYTGNSHELAQLLGAMKGWPVGEIVETHPRSGATGYARCALDSLFARHPAIRYEGPDPADFALVVLVAPIWMQRLAGPMRTFVAENRERIHRAAVLVSMGERGGSNAPAEIARLLGKDPVLAEVVTAREIEDGSCAPAVEAFAKALCPPGPPQALRPAVLSPEAV